MNFLKACFFSVLMLLGVQANAYTTNTVRILIVFTPSSHNALLGRVPWVDCVDAACFSAVFVSKLNVATKLPSLPTGHNDPSSTIIDNEIAGIITVPDTNMTGLMGTALFSLRKNPAVIAARKTLEADVVMAFVNTVEGNSFDDYGATMPFGGPGNAFSVVNVYKALQNDRWSALHEYGHLLGASHLDGAFQGTRPTGYPNPTYDCFTDVLVPLYDSRRQDTACKAKWPNGNPPNVTTDSVIRFPYFSTEFKANESPWTYVGDSSHNALKAMQLNSYVVMNYHKRRIDCGFWCAILDSFR